MGQGWVRDGLNNKSVVNSGLLIKKVYDKQIRVKLGLM